MDGNGAGKGAGAPREGGVAFDVLRKQQAAWLQEIIREPAFRDAPYRVVFCHLPLRWRDETPPNYDSGGFDRFSLRSRQQWHESLVAWKAQFIISGHTHRDAWLPAKTSSLTGNSSAAVRKRTVLR